MKNIKRVEFQIIYNSNVVWLGRLGWCDFCRINPKLINKGRQGLHVGFSVQIGTFAVHLRDGPRV